MLGDFIEPYHVSKIIVLFQACWKVLLLAKEEIFNQGGGGGGGEIFEKEAKKGRSISILFVRRGRRHFETASSGTGYQQELLHSNSKMVYYPAFAFVS